MSLSFNSHNIATKSFCLVATLTISSLTGCYQANHSNSDINDVYHTPMHRAPMLQEHMHPEHIHQYPMHHESMNQSHVHQSRVHHHGAYNNSHHNNPHAPYHHGNDSHHMYSLSEQNGNSLAKYGMNNSVSSEDNLASGHYSRTIRASDNSNNDNNNANGSINTDSDITVMVHVAQISLLKPAKQISLSVSSKPSKTANLDVDSLGGQPACEFRGTANLMGQDALHGVIYTFPVDKLAINQTVNYATSNSTVKMNNSAQESNNHSGLVFLRFKDNKLTIDSNHASALDSICRGNLSLKGDYSKLN